jgi:hypothetical protein
MSDTGWEQAAAAEGMEVTQYRRWKGAGGAVQLMGLVLVVGFIIFVLIAAALPDDYEGWALAAGVGAGVVYTFVTIYRVCRDRTPGSRPYDDFAMRNAIAASIVVLWVFVVALRFFAPVGSPDSDFADNLFDDLNTAFTVILGAYFVGTGVAEAVRRRDTSLQPEANDR